MKQKLKPKPGSLVVAVTDASVYSFAGPNLTQIHDGHFVDLKEGTVGLVVGLHSNSDGFVDELLVLAPNGPLGWIYANDLRAL